MRLRRLTVEDIPAAARLTDAAFGGGPRADRLRRYLTIEPQGWLVVEDAGRLVAVGGVVRFGTFAWLGLMAVHPDRQGRGLGRTIAEEAIGWALGQGCSPSSSSPPPQACPSIRGWASSTQASPRSSAGGRYLWRLPRR